MLHLTFVQAQSCMDAFRDQACQPSSMCRSQQKSKPPSQSASIFGNAKPVDTAARERAIEDKIRKQEQSMLDEYDERWDNDQTELQTLSCYEHFSCTCFHVFLVSLMCISCFVKDFFDGVSSKE